MTYAACDYNGGYGDDSISSLFWTFGYGMAQAAMKNVPQEEEYLSQEETSCSFLRRPRGRIEGCCDRSGYRPTLDEFSAAPICLDAD